MDEVFVPLSMNDCDLITYILDEYVKLTDKNIDDVCRIVDELETIIDSDDTYNIHENEVKKPVVTKREDNVVFVDFKRK